jgi:hypothetical protein
MRFLAHNVIAHPIAGILWALGLDAIGDRVHEWWAPPPKKITVTRVMVDVTADHPDPDQIFAAFLPKMIEHADKRTALYKDL